MNSWQGYDVGAEKREQEILQRKIEKFERHQKLGIIGKDINNASGGPVLLPDSFKGKAYLTQ